MIKKIFYSVLIVSSVYASNTIKDDIVEADILRKELSEIEASFEKIKALTPQFNIVKNKSINDRKQRSNCFNGYSGEYYNIDCYNKGINNLLGWSNLEKVNGELNLQHNKLNDVIIDSIFYAGKINMSDNSIQKINLPSLLAVGGDFDLSSNYLTNLTGIDKLKYIDGTFNLANNEMFEISTLDNLEYINGDLKLNDNNFKELHGFNTLKKISGAIYLSNNNISVISAFKNLFSVSSIFAHRNSLSDVSGFENLIIIEKDLNLNHNKLFNINGLNKLAFIGKNLNLSNNQLESIDGLESLIYIGNDCMLSNNELISLKGLNNLFAVKGDFYLNNLKLEKLDQLESFEYLGGDLYLKNNPNLIDISILNNLYMEDDRKIIIDDFLYFQKLNADSVICTKVRNGKIRLIGTKLENICENK